jgi:hypothetical protein
MSNPLFKTEGSVWGPGQHVDQTDRDEDDEEWVDESLPSSPLDRTFGQDPFEAGPSRPTAYIPTVDTPVRANAKEEVLDDVKPELEEFDVDKEETPLREMYSDEDEQEPEDERQCRICFSGREEESTLGRLISPCLCTGSVRVSDECRRGCNRADRQYVHGM